MPDFDFGLALVCVGGARMLVERGSGGVEGENCKETKYTTMRQSMEMTN